MKLSDESNFEMVHKDLTTLDTQAKIEVKNNLASMRDVITEEDSDSSNEE